MYEKTIFNTDTGSLLALALLVVVIQLGAEYPRQCRFLCDAA